MKIITKTTMFIDPEKSVPPGTEVELDDAEAQSLIDRGLAEVPTPPEAAAEATAKKK